jgi:hypothetical protein
MFKIRSDPKLSNPNPIRVVIKYSNPIRSEEFFNKINFSFTLKCLTKSIEKQEIHVKKQPLKFAAAFGNFRRNYRRE